MNARHASVRGHPRQYVRSDFLSPLGPSLFPQPQGQLAGNTMSDNSQWYIEHFQPTGSAIGFRINGKLDEVQSPFQKIEIYDSTDWGKLMIIDGAMMLTTKDNFFYHEMISHPV